MKTDREVLEILKKAKQDLMGSDFEDPKLSCVYRRLRMYIDKMISLLE